jgi:hypothetical protein
MHFRASLLALACLLLLAIGAHATRSLDFVIATGKRSSTARADRDGAQCHKVSHLFRMHAAGAQCMVEMNTLQVRLG